MRCRVTGDRKSKNESWTFRSPATCRLHLPSFAGTANPNTVTKWRIGNATPEAARVDRMLEAFQIFKVLVGLGLSETNAEQWFRGKNPVLGLKMPVDVLATGDFGKVVEAVRSLASE